MPDVLPSSLPHISRGTIERNGEQWLPTFCANCGHDGPMITEKQRAFSVCWLCVPCGEKWSPMLGLQMTADEVFFQRVADAQLEEKGRSFTAEELIAALDDATSPLSKLAKEGPR